ncbi:MAG: DNA gyrase inhibitor YacG [Phycisphaerales bacterium]|nr:DNA gyrase inhibitor YacG [Phycisphaerales bacterium]
MPLMECPTCGRRVEYRSKTEVPFRPFCCRRCKLIDLHKWLNEEYRVSEELAASPLDQSSSFDSPPGGSGLSEQDLDEPDCSP